MLEVDRQRGRRVGAPRGLGILDLVGVDQDQTLIGVQQERLLVAHAFVTKRLTHLVLPPHQLCHPAAQRVDLIGPHAMKVDVEHAAYCAQKKEPPYRRLVVEDEALSPAWGRRPCDRRAFGAAGPW
jgi:hypothetical protein